MIFMTKVPPNLTLILLDHLKAQVMLGNADILAKGMDFVDYDPSKLKFWVSNGKIHLSTITGDLSSRYYREFSTDMIISEYRHLFFDFSYLIDAFIQGTVELDLDLLLQLEPKHGTVSCEHLIDIFDIFLETPLKLEFYWQIVGLNTLSIEPKVANKNFTLPTIVLDYLFLYNEQAAAL